MYNLWKIFFKNYPERQNLSNVDKINEKRKTTTIFPPQDEVFKVFDLELKI